MAHSTERQKRQWKLRCALGTIMGVRGFINSAVLQVVNNTSINRVIKITLQEKADLFNAWCSVAADAVKKELQDMKQETELLKKNARELAQLTKRHE